MKRKHVVAHASAFACASRLDAPNIKLLDKTEFRETALECSLKLRDKAVQCNREAMMRRTDDVVTSLLVRKTTID